jgi:hypothetical protein
VFWIPEHHSGSSISLSTFNLPALTSSIFFINSSAFSRNVGGNSRVPSSGSICLHAHNTSHMIHLTIRSCSIFRHLGIATA